MQKLSVFNRLNMAQISLFFIGGMFLLPHLIPYHYSPIPTFYNEWVAAVLGVLGMTALLSQEYRASFAIPRSSLIFLGLLLITYLQTLFNPQDAVSNLALIQSYLLWAFLLSILGHHLRTTLGWQPLTKVLAWAILLAGFANVIFVALQFAQQAGAAIAIPQLSSYGMLAQNNNFADLIALSIASLLYLSEKKYISSKAITTTGCFLGLVLLALSGSRSSALYLLAIALLSWYFRRQSTTQSADFKIYNRLWRISLTLLPVFILIQLTLAEYFPHTLVQTPIMRAIDLAQTHPQSLRWQLWQTCLYLFNQAPLLGVGTGQMRWQTFLLADNALANPAQIFFEHGHNLFLHLLAEMGIFAFILAGVGLFLWAKSFITSYRINIERWWLLTMSSILLIHSMLEYPLWYSFFLGIFSFLMGAGDSKSLSLKNLSQSMKNLLSLSLLITVLYGLQQLIVMETGYRKLEHQIAVGSQQTMTSIEKEALINDMLWVSQNTLLGPSAELVIATFMIPIPDQAQAQLALVESAVKFVPLRRPCLNLVILLEMTHQHTQALAFLNRFITIAGVKLNHDIQLLPLSEQTMINNLIHEIQMSAKQHESIQHPRFSHMS